MANLYSILLAPNPSPLTGPGTNTIIVGSKETGALVIDPGDDQPEHLSSIIQEGEQFGGIRRILISHGHSDHLAGARELREQLGVPVLAFSREGVPFLDQEIADNETFVIGDDRLRAIFTPGHRFDHMCFLLEKQRTLFAGDLLASASTVVIPAPPEGSMSDYLRSLEKIQQLEVNEIVPAHGLIITQPQQKLADYITHRYEREQQILQLLATRPEGVTVAAIVDILYATTDYHLLPLAAQSVTAHLYKLAQEGKVLHHVLPEQEKSEYWQLVPRSL